MFDVCSLIRIHHSRYKEGNRKTWETPPTTTAASATSMNTFANAGSSSGGGGIGASNLVLTQKDVGAPNLQSQLPVLTSHCPGWVCYAEKSQPQAIPYMSSVKSAQQIMGSVFKHVIASKTLGGTDSGCCLEKEASNVDISEDMDGTSAIESNNKKREVAVCCGEGNKDVYFVSIQPCFDKKLESSRLVRNLYLLVNRYCTI